MRRLLLFTILLYSGGGIWVHLYGQARCGTSVLLDQELQKSGLTHGQYMEQVEQEMKYVSGTQARLQSAQVYQVAVVMHILHHGQPIGSGSNVSKASIDRQIEVLNKAFAETHPHVANIPAEFVGNKAGDTNIRFALANRDPNGNYTRGFTRTQIPQREYVFRQLPSLRSAWDQRTYLNVWVIPYSSFSGGYIGIATYPPTELKDYDGIGILTESLPGLGGTTVRGKTLVHEVGHYLGLQHTWGRDGDRATCSDDDGCRDTPLQFDAWNASRCSEIRGSCGNNRNMIENYMSYSVDICLLMFTQCQRNKMRNVLAGHRYRSLLRQNISQAIKAETLSESVKRHDGEIQALEVSQNTHNSKITALETQYNTHNRKVTALETQYNTHNEQITNMAAKIAALETEIQRLKGGSSTLVYHVPQAENKEAVRLYPNPSTQYLQFAGLVPVQSYIYKIYAPTGVLLLSGTLQSTDIIDISSLSQGQYMLTLDSAAGKEIFHNTLIVK